MINDYRDLDVWKHSMDLAVDIYRQTGHFPREEMFGLTSQMRRAASSIPANIAEGYGRQQRRSFVQYLRISQGSLKELETHLELACRVGFASRENVTAFGERTGSLGKMLRSLIRSLEAKDAGK